MGLCCTKQLTIKERRDRCNEIHGNIFALEQLTLNHCNGFAPNKHVIDLQIAKQMAKYYQSFFPIYNQFVALEVINFENLQIKLKKHIDEYNELFPDNFIDPNQFTMELSKNLFNSLKTYQMVICNVGLMRD